MALIGEAAHVIPPIGAQGLNLGLRDAAAIGELVVEAHRAGDDVGAAELLARYDRHAPRRRHEPHVRGRRAQPLAAADFLPVQGMRGLGLYLVDRIAPLRRAVMREGIAPSPRTAADARRNALSPPRRGSPSAAHRVPKRKCAADSRWGEEVRLSGKSFQIGG